MSKGKRKQLINPHDCKPGEDVFFEVTRSEFIDEGGNTVPFVRMTCEVCKETVGGETLKDAIKEWNAAHPLPKRRMTT